MSSHLSDAERSLIGALAAHESWARTTDRAARTAPARAALEKRFLDEAGGDPERAAQLRKAYYLRLALKSAQSRRLKTTRGRSATTVNADASGAEWGGES